MREKKGTSVPKEKAGQKTIEGIPYDAVHVVGDVTVYKSYDKDGYPLWDCLLEAMGKQ